MEGRGKVISFRRAQFKHKIKVLLIHIKEIVLNIVYRKIEPKDIGYKEDINAKCVIKKYHKKNHI